MKKILITLLAVLMLILMISCNQEIHEDLFNAEDIRVLNVDYEVSENSNLLVKVTASEKANKLWYRLGTDGKWTEMSLKDGKEFSEEELLCGISFKVSYTRQIKGIENETVQSEIHYLGGWLVKTEKNETDVSRYYLLKSSDNTYYHCVFKDWRLDNVEKGTLSAENFTVGDTNVYEFCKEDKSAFATLQELENAADELKAFIKVEDNAVAFNKNIGSADEFSLIVTFVTEEGVSAPKSQKIKSGETVTIPSDPSKANFRFMGWYSNQTFNTVWNFETKVTTNTNIYAKFVPNNTVTYDSNGSTSGNIPVDGSYYINGETVTVLGNTGNLAKTGYSFDGWNTNAYGTGTDYATASTFTINNSVTLYAQWKACEYTITYKDQGNTTLSADTNTSPVSHTYASTTTLVNPVKTGHSFGGWFLDTECTTSPVTSLNPTSFTDNIVLYAKWSPSEYSITYNFHTGTAPVVANHSTYTYGDGVGTFNAPTRTGYTFKGWFDAETEGTEITIISTTDIGDKTLHAQWTANSYTVKFDGNGNTSGTMTDQSFTYDETSKALSENDFERTGYEFTGWAISETGEVVYTNKQSVQNLTSENEGTVTLYAKWVQVFAITYELHDGTAPTGESANPTTYKVGTGVASFSDSTRTGYTFNGWYDAATGGNKVESISATDTGDKTLHAQWTANQYIITFDVANIW